MTFANIQELLQWAREHRVAHIKAEDVEVSFFPEKDKPAAVPRGGFDDLRDRIDSELLGINLGEDNTR